MMRIRYSKHYCPKKNVFLFKCFTVLKVVHFSYCWGVNKYGDIPMMETSVSSAVVASDGNLGMLSFYHTHLSLTSLLNVISSIVLSLSCLLIAEALIC